MKKIGIISAILISAFAFGQDEVKKLKPNWELNKEYVYIGSTNFRSSSNFETLEHRGSFGYECSYTPIQKNGNEYIIKAVVPNTSLIKILDFLPNTKEDFRDFDILEIYYSYNAVTGVSEIKNHELIKELSAFFVQMMQEKVQKYPSEEARMLVFISDFEKQTLNKEGINALFQEEMGWFTNGLNHDLELEADETNKAVFQFPGAYAIPCESSDLLTLDDINKELKTATFTNIIDLNEDKLKTSFINELKDKLKAKTITTRETNKLNNEKNLSFSSTLKEVYTLNYEETVPQKIKMFYELVETSDLGTTTHSNNTTIVKKD